MTVQLITAMRAAVTLAAHHRRLAENSTGETRAYHLDMIRRCLGDIENIRGQIAAAGVTPEHQVNVLHQRDLETAQAIIARHVLPEWLTDERAPRALEAMAQDIADAMLATRGGTAPSRQ